MATTGAISKSEKSYIQAALQASSPSRADGRSLLDYRAIALETGIAPLANGSARVNIGKHGGQESGSGTEVLAAVKLEVEDACSGGDGVDGGRIACSVSCSPAAYPHLSSAALDDLSYDMTTVVHQSLSHSSLHPPNLGIIPRKKSWLLNLDIMVLSDSGNIYDALFMAARSALWDTKVPRTRSVQYQVKKKSDNGSGAVASTGEHDLDMDEQESSSGFVTRQINNVADFDLPDYWDEGEPLGSRDQWPVCVTLNLLPNVGYFVDATSQEEASTALRLLLLFSFPVSGVAHMQTLRLMGDGELQLSSVSSLLKEGESYARELFAGLEVKLRDEDIRRNQKARIKFGVR